MFQEAQLTGQIPCLNIVTVSNDTKCPALSKPECLEPGPLKVAEHLHGEWVLYSADPTYVMNQKCTVTQMDDTEMHLFTCSSERYYNFSLLCVLSSGLQKTVVVIIVLISRKC